MERPNQVWCVDITYLPMRRGAQHGLGPVAALAPLYLDAIIDWHSRMVLLWRISDTLNADFCVEGLNEAIYRFGPPDIMKMEHGRAIGPSGDARQGSQFTSFTYTDRLRRWSGRISMNGKGRYLDNIFIERLRRTPKSEYVYLHARESGSQAHAGVRNWMEFYNPRRPHKAFGGQPPAVIHSRQIKATQPDQQELI